MTQRTLITTIVLGCAVLAVGGCATHYAAEEGFGDTVRAAKAQQIVNPDASRNTAAPTGFDGAAAKATVDRYQKSFETTQPATNVFNIGVGTSGGGQN
ncbi:hypothetical protein GCM10027343_22050 [Noviherbaspirillum agri]